MDNQENQEQQLLMDQETGAEKVVEQGAQMAGQAVANKAKELGEEASKKAGKTILQILKKSVSFIFANLFWILVAIVIIIIMAYILQIVGAFTNLFNGSNSKEITDTRAYITSDENGIILSSDNDIMEGLKELLKENGIKNITDLGLGKEKEAEKYILKFYKSTMATQLPYIPGVEAISDKYIQGIVHIKRTETTVEEARELIWMGYEQFKEKVEAEQADSSLLNYYSIDNNWNLCVAIYTETRTNGITDSYKISEAKIPYQTLISQYSVPLRYITTMQQITQNPEYISKMCDMFVKNKQIDFTIFDSIETTIYTHTYNHSLMTKWVEEVTVENEVDNGDGTTTTETSTKQVQKTSGPTEQPTQVTVNTTITNTIMGNVTLANTWLVELINNYQKETTTEYPLGENGQTTQLEDEEEPPGEEGTWRVDQTNNLKEQVIKNIWAKAESEPPKVKESEFLGLWRNEKGEYELGADFKSEKEGGKLVYYIIPNSKQKQTPMINLYYQQQFLFEILEDDETTQNYATIMKYLFYKYDGKDYGVTELDLSIFEANEFQVITGSGVGGVGGAGGAGGEFSLTTTMFTREIFIQALQDYAAKSGNANFIANFLPRAGEIYDLSIKYNVNPEFVVTMAKKESSFAKKGTNENYWGLDTPNGSALSNKSFEGGIAGLADRVKRYGDPSNSHYKAIVEESTKRQVAGCNPNGYGEPTTLRGFLLRYSDLIGNYNNGYHTEGGQGSGGAHYLKIIYGAEYDAKCGYHSDGRVGAGGHTANTKITIQERADYTAWLYENQLTYWDEIFGKFGSLSGGETEATQTDGNSGYTTTYTSKVGIHKLFKQNAGYYASQLYVATESKGPISGNGCCPTSLAIVASGYGIQTDPGKTAELMGGTRGTQQSSASNAARVLRGLGLNASDFYGVNANTATTIREHLKSGGTVMISVRGSNPYGTLFTNNNHWIAVLGINETTDEVFVGNPNHKANGWYKLDQVVSAAKSKWGVLISK